MQKYNIIEVLNAPVGAKFKDKDGQVWEIQAGINSNFLLNAEAVVMTLNSYTINLEFERVQEPLDFKEMIQKLSKTGSKNIRVEHKLYNLTKNHYCTLSDLMSSLGNTFYSEELTDIFLNGKWYLEED